MKKNNYTKQTVPYLLLLMVMVGVLIFYSMSQNTVNTFTYDYFMNELSEGNVSNIEVTNRGAAGIRLITGQLEDYNENESFRVNVPISEAVLERILVYVEEHEVEMVTNTDPGNNMLIAVLGNLIPIIIMIAVVVWLFTKISGSNKNSVDFGRSRAKLSEEGKAKFNDVAGLIEEKEEVSELIDFLKSPKKFQKLGARIPKGVLLVGPPGTGKTLLAKAVAGEANVPFYYISGSDFVELFVGVGASRVRDMFKQAKQTAPCLIFIDEIDAVGRQRGTGVGGGHDEREQTLNQLLTEMDGFGSNEGIIIIAATNRPDVLDPALLRPGRFDRQVTVNLPSKKARTEILKVHAKNKTFSNDVKLEAISNRTPGYSGADLENVLNEAALLTVRENKTAIDMGEIDEAIDRVMMGPAKVTMKMTDDEKERIAYHEAGHAVLGILLENASDVHKITVIPRGNALGYNLMLPKEEKSLATKTELEEQMVGYLGGRAVEEIMFDEISTGAYNDIEQATRIARAMVTEYGMSDLGPMQLEKPSGNVFLGRDYAKSRNFSDKVAFEIDSEVRKIIMNAEAKAKKVLNKNMDMVHLIAKALMEYETLTKEQIEYLVEYKKMPENCEVNQCTLKELKQMAKIKGVKGYTKMTKEELMKELDL